MIYIHSGSNLSWLYNVGKILNAFLKELYNIIVLIVQFKDLITLSVHFYSFLSLCQSFNMQNFKH
jgi:hypothetical protein